jgi:hypothetical protein
MQLVIVQNSFIPFFRKTASMLHHLSINRMS